MITLTCQAYHIPQGRREALQFLTSDDTVEGHQGRIIMQGTAILEPGHSIDLAADTKSATNQGL